MAANRFTIQSLISGEKNLKKEKRTVLNFMQINKISPDLIKPVIWGSIWAKHLGNQTLAGVLYNNLILILSCPHQVDRLGVPGTMSHCALHQTFCSN